MTTGPFDLLLGRRTYEIFAGYWPNAPEEAGGKGFNDATKYVCSRSRPSLAWTPMLLMEGDAAEGVAALKAEDDGPELQVHGSGNLVQALIHHGLVDEYRLWVFPLVLGMGKRLSTSDGSATALTRDPIWTPSPPILPSIVSNSPSSSRRGARRSDHECILLTNAAVRNRDVRRPGASSLGRN